MADPQELQDYDSQLKEYLTPQPDALDSAGAAMAGAIQSLPTTRAYQAFKRSQMGEGEPLLSPKELNNRYPNVEVPFNEPLPDSVARDISDKQAFKQYLGNVVAHGPQNVPQKLLNFAAGTAPALIDPIFLGTGALTGGAAELAGVGGMITAGEGAGLAETALKGAAHAGASMLAPEALSGVLANQAHEDYSLKDYLENVGGAALFAGALHTLPPAVRFLKGTLGGKPDMMAETAATSQLLRGKNVEVSPLVSQMTGEMDGGVNPGPEFHSPLPPYEYKPLDTSQPVTGKFYHGSERSLGGLSEVDHPVLEHDLGPGLYLTDNPQVANGVAARGLAEAPGKVIEAELRGAKLLDLEQPLPKDAHRALTDTLDQGYQYQPMDVSEPTSGKIMYHGTKGDLASLSEANVYDHNSVNNLYGEGLYLTDRPAVAESYAENRGKGPAGRVLSGKLKNLNLVDLEQPLPDNAWKIYSHELGKYWSDSEVKKLRDQPGTRVFDSLREAMSNGEITKHDAIETFTDLNRQLSDAGYDGLRHQGGDRFGTKKHNVAILFEDKGFKDGQAVGRVLKNKIEDVPYDSARGKIGKEVLNGLSPDQASHFEQGLREAGYDGLRHQGGDFLGSDNAPHNVVKLFDPASPKVAETGQFEPSAEITRQPGQGELQAIADHQQSVASDRLHDPVEHEEFQKLLDHPAEPWDVNEAKTTMDAEMESLRAIQDQGHLDQAGSAELERIQDDAKKDGMREQAWKSYMNCLVGNG